VEGLVAAYHLTRRAGATETAQHVLNAAALSVAFQVRLQYRPESTQGFPRPSRALGGFPSAVGEPVMRVDFLQHNASSILGFLRIMQAEKIEEAPNPDTLEGRLIRQARAKTLAPDPRLQRHVEWIRGW